MAASSGAATFGGFDGTETKLNQRDPAAHITVIDGTGAPGRKMDVAVDGSRISGLYKPSEGRGAMAIDADGIAHISYWDYSNGNLKYARWSGTGWELQVVESEGQVGM